MHAAFGVLIGIGIATAAIMWVDPLAIAVGRRELVRTVHVTAGILALVGSLVGNIGPSLHRERPPAQFVVLFLAALLTLSVRGLFAAQGDVAAWLSAFPVHVLLRATYTALLGPLVYLVARALGAPDFLSHGAISTES